MPVMVGQAQPRVSQLVVDANLTIPTAYRIIAENIQPPAGAHLYLNTAAGVHSLRIYEDFPAVKSFGPLYIDAIQEGSTGARTAFGTGIKTDVIDDNGGGLINILESCQLAATKYLAAPTLLADMYGDQAGTGAAPFPLGIQTDDIGEYTASHGIDLNDPVALAALTTLLTQRYRTATAGDTQRWASDAEVSIANPGAVETVIKTGPTVPDWYSGSSNVFRITFDGRATNPSPDDQMYLTVNGVEVGARCNLANIGYTTWSQDIGSLSAGDVIRVVCINPAGTGGKLYCRNFRVKSTDTVAIPMTTETW